MKRLMFLPLFLAAISCQSNSLNVEPLGDKSLKTESQHPYARQIDDALSVATDFLDELDADMLAQSEQNNLFQTKSVTMDRTIGSIQSIVNNDACLTKSSLGLTDSPILYLVNYDDNKGFALLGADNRLPYVYAISNEGHLELSDTLANPGLAFVLKGIRRHITATLNAEQNNDAVSSHSATVLVTVQKCSPLYGNSDLVEWHQRSPYNKYCYTNTGQQALVGCTAVATTQIMAYHQWPKKLDGVTYRWREMIKGANDDAVAKFMAKIGEPQYLNMNYGVSSSGASVANALKTFSAFGYTHSGEIDYNEDKLIVGLLGNKNDLPMKFGPAMSIGYYQESDGSYSGHAWVIDGFIKKAIYLDTTPDNDEDNADVFAGYAPLMVHCIWGWNTTKSNFNGYYYVNGDNPSFNLVNGPVDSKGNRLPNGGVSSTEYNKYLSLVIDFYAQKFS